MKRHKAQAHDDLDSSPIRTKAQPISFIKLLNEQFISYRRRIVNFWEIFSLSRSSVVGLIIILSLFFVAAFARWIIPYAPDWQPLGSGQAAVFLPPSLDPPAYAPDQPPHYLGTDEIGHDLFSRLIWGSRASLTVGFVASFVSFAIGIVVGAVSGYFRGVVDHILMRFTDILITMPTLPLYLFIASVMYARTGSAPSIYMIMLIIGLLSWPGVARLVRSEILSLREREFVEAARAIGASDKRILFRHVLPSTFPVIMITLTMSIAGSVLVESGISFLGLGDPTAVTWGSIITGGQKYIFSWADYWWYTIPPGLLILITVTSFNLVGKGLTDALNPKLRDI